MVMTVASKPRQPSLFPVALAAHVPSGNSTLVVLCCAGREMRGKLKSQRNHQFDLLRILFATFVLLAHAPELTDGNASRELFHRFTGAPMTFGTLGVDGFFLLSGYLIVQSWMADPRPLSFLRKRVLRIFPGYLVAVLVSTLAVGLLAPGVPRFFAGIDGHFLNSVALLGSPATPPVLPGKPYPTVNGALYTIAYEFRCYLMVALLGLCGLFRRPAIVLAMAVAFLAALFSPSPFEQMQWPRHIVALVGQPILIFRLTGIYLVGCCFFLLRERIPFRAAWAIGAAAALVACFLAFPSHGELATVLLGGYLLFYLGQLHLPQLSWMAGVPDISYGIYLYGWPVESLWIWYHRGSPWIAFFASTLICFGLGWVSWQLVEKPALRWKRTKGMRRPIHSPEPSSLPAV
jgi:peptidoglycan/LPS O-acetylase OafA/YrhL